MGTTSRRGAARWLALVAGLSLGLGGAACSGGDDDDGAAATSTTIPGASTTSGPSDTTSAGTVATSTVPPSELPDCPVAALDDAAGPVDITFWHAMTAANEEALVALARDYNESQTRVRVTLVNQTGYDQNLDKFRTASAADRPEIVQLSETSLQLMIDSGTALPVAACAAADGYSFDDHLERVVNYYTVQGVLWPMPFNTSNPVLFYNKKAFAAANLDPEVPPRTLTELEEASRALVASGVVKYGIAIDTSADAGGGWFLEQWFAKAGQLYADNDNGRSDRATSVLFENDLGVELFTYLQRMIQEGLAFNVGANPTGTDNLLKIADETEPAAMTINTSAAIGSVLNILAQGTFPNVELGVGPMPAPEGPGGVLVGGAALWLVEDKPDEKIAAAWDFMKFLNEPASQAAWAAETGYIPIRKSTADEPVMQAAWAETPELKVAYDQLLGGSFTTATAGPVLGPQRQIREIVAKELEKLFLGQTDPQSAITEAAEGADEELADYAERVG